MVGVRIENGNFQDTDEYPAGGFFLPLTFMDGSLARKTDLTGSLAEEKASARRVTARCADPCGKISCSGVMGGGGVAGG